MLKKVQSTAVKRGFYFPDKSSRYMGQVSTKRGVLAPSYASGASSRLCFLDGAHSRRTEREADRTEQALSFPQIGSEHTTADAYQG
jgi:hypothetical protein